MLTRISRRLALMLAAAVLATSPAVAAEPLKIGVSAGPLASVLELTAEIARKKGVDTKVVEFSDWITPNEAVNSGDLDANFFQHAAFLATQNANRGFKLVQVDKAGVIVPVGLFSRKIKSLDELKPRDRVAISNDTINGGRALQLLEKAGLIKLKAGIGLRATPLDVVENPKGLKFIELDAAQIYRSLDDVAVGMVNLTYLIPAGGDPRSALIVDRTIEDQLVLRFTSRPEKKDDPRLRAFIDVFRSPEVQTYIKDKLPAFIPVT